MKINTNQILEISKARIGRFHPLELIDILRVSWEDARKMQAGENVVIEMERIEAIDACGKLAEASYMNCRRPLGTFRTRLYNARNEFGYASTRARKAFPI